MLGISLLLRAQGNRLRVAAIAVYVSGVVFALSVSGVFHLAVRNTQVREVMRVIDHAGIFFLIAGALAYTLGAVPEYARVPTLAPGVLGPMR